MAFYTSNLPEHLPTGYLDEFQRWLTEDGPLILIAEHEGVPVACGGISYEGTCDIAYLSFGIVDLSKQGLGYGTTLLLARLALLDTELPGRTVCMQVTSASFNFYRRFGFQCYDTDSDERDQRFGYFSRFFTPKEILDCRRMIAEAGVTLPSEWDIPLMNCDIESLMAAAGDQGELGQP